LPVSRLTDDNGDVLSPVLPEQRKQSLMPQQKHDWASLSLERAPAFLIDNPNSPRCSQRTYRQPDEGPSRGRR
jgi:hypothetical protein